MRSSEQVASSEARGRPDSFLRGRPSWPPAHGPRLVLAPDVVVEALEDRRSGAFRLLRALRRHRCKLAVSVPLALEWEEALGGVAGAETVVDFLCAAALRVWTFYLWRPRLRDPRKDLLLSLAVAAGCRAIVSGEAGGLSAAAAWDVGVWSPAEALRRIGGGA